ncbi:MAG: hypothetical protein M3Y09_03505, partial [Actinomycetota bacterium]|nr:hypothetical protein [Actinomycetota bacterium]
TATTDHRIRTSAARIPAIMILSSHSRSSPRERNVTHNFSKPSDNHPDLGATGSLPNTARHEEGNACRTIG